MIRQQEIIKIRAKTVVLRFRMAGQFSQIHAIRFGFDITNRQPIHRRGEIRPAGGDLLGFAEKHNRTPDLLRRRFQETV